MKGRRRIRPYQAMTREALARIQAAKLRKRENDREAAAKIKLKPTLSPEALRIKELQDEIEKDDERLGPLKLFDF